MLNQKITVVVPVYNVQDYLERCVNSIINQTYNNIEIILVDDGSTDKSGMICDEYSKKDNRIKVIHKKNGGLAEARNYGIKQMSGDFICFVDSDDWISLDCIELLYNNIINNSADICVANFMVKYDSDKDNSLRKQQKIEVVGTKKALELYLYQRISASAWAKLYHRRLFENICYPTGQLYEDVETTYNLIKKAEHIVISDAIVYYYYSRIGSIVKSDFTIKKMDYYNATNNLYIDVKKQYVELEQAAISRMVWAELHLIVKMGNKRKEYIDENKVLWNDVKRFRKGVLRDSHVRKVNKLLLLISFFGQGALCSAYRLNSRIKKH